MLQISKGMLAVSMILSFNCIQSASLEGTVMVPSGLGELSLHHVDNDFYVEQNAQLKRIQRCDMDKELRGISQDKLAKMIAAGSYLKINQFDNGEYTLRVDSRLNGGGPFTGAAVYWLVKAAGYGVPAGIAAASASALATAALPAVLATGTTGVTTTIIGTQMATTTAAVTVSSTAATAGTIAGEMIVTAIGAETASGALVAAGSTGTLTAYITGVEAAATGLSTLATICPWLP